MTSNRNMLAGEGLVWKERWQRQGSSLLLTGDGTHPWMEGDSNLAGNLEGSPEGRQDCHWDPVQILVSDPQGRGELVRPEIALTPI